MCGKLIHKYQSLPVQIRASCWFLVCSFLQKGISVITTPIFTRLLSTEEYGQFSVFISWSDIVTIFVTLRLCYGAFTQGLVKYEDDRKRYASSMQGLGLTLSLAWTVVYCLSYRFWNSIFGLTTVQMLAMLVTMWTTSAFGFWAAEQRVQYKYKMLVIITVGVSVLKPTVGILMVLHADDKVTARILGLMLVEVIGYTGLFFIQTIRGKQFYSRKYWKHALMFNIPLIPHYLSQTVLNSSDRIMIKSMVGASAAGIYSLAYSISKIMTMFTQAVTQTLTPWMYQKIKTKKAKDIEVIAYPALIAIGTVTLALIAFAPEVVMLFAPTAYRDAIWVIPPVAMSVYFIFCYSLFANFEFYYEETKFIMVASLGGAILNVFLNYIFIQRFGYHAAGYTTLICYIVYAIGHYFFMCRICREHLQGEMVYNTKKLLIISSTFLVIAFAFLLTYKNIILRYSLVAILLVVALCRRKQIKKVLKQLLDIRSK